MRSLFGKGHVSDNSWKLQMLVCLRKIWRGVVGFFEKRIGPSMGSLWQPSVFEVQELLLNLKLRLLFP